MLDCDRLHMLCLIMAPWYEREHPTPFDSVPIQGRHNLIGDELALKYRQAWVEGKKYPIIHFPSEIERELTTGGDDNVPHVHIFGAVELPYQCTRDEAFNHIIPT